MSNFAGPFVGSGLFQNSLGERLKFARGDGATVYDQNNKSYIDFILGVGPVILGHGDAKFNECVAKHVSVGLNLPSYSELHYDYAEYLMDGSPGEHKVILFTKTASEAVSFALRLSAMETGRLGVIRCGYLGQSDIAIGNSIKWHEPLNSPYRTQRRLLSGCRGFTESEPVFDWEDLDLASLKSLLERFSDTIGAFAVDAQQFVFIDENKASSIFNLCREHDVRVILDETKTAGRIGPRGYFDYLTPDIDYVVLGKAIGNGAPIAVLTGTADRSSLYREAKIGGTHSKEVFGAAAGLTVLELMNERDGYNRLPHIIEKMANAINIGLVDAGVIQKLSAKGFLKNTIFELVFSQELLENQIERDQIRLRFQEAGIFIMEGHCSFVSLAHDSLDPSIVSELTYRAMTGRIRNDQLS